MKNGTRTIARDGETGQRFTRADIERMIETLFAMRSQATREQKVRIDEQLARLSAGLEGK